MFFWDIQKSEKTTVLLSLCIAITATALGDILAPVYYAKFTKSSIGELNANGSAKEFDGFSVGDFFKFNGEYEYVRQNEVFVKAMVEGQMVSVPLHKVQEVK